MGRFVGIDLGTTYSVVAYINEHGKAEVIPNEHGLRVTPSVIYFGGSTPIVGDEAKEYQETGAAEVASFFKRNMDDPYFLLSFQGRDYTAIDLSALVLAYLKKQAENFLREPVSEAVITVPAYFTHNQRRATIEAGREAGLNVLKIISEPTSAALAYGLRPNASEEKQVFLVYDLGGGTFDVSLVSVTAKELVVLATDGDHHLGGKDWDDRLLEYLGTQFERDFQAELLGDDINALRVQSEKLKRSLSARESASTHVQAGGHAQTYTITREHFEHLTRDLMERTQILVEQVLKEANMTWEELSGVLPVGGSTRLPMVTDYIRRMSGKPPMTGINPDEAVGLGAAIQAAIEMEEMRLPAAPAPMYRLAGRKSTVDVIAHSLGLVAENADRSRYINSILIGKNLPIPSTQVRPYQLGLRRRGNTELEVFLTQGESDDPQQCVYLGRYVFSDFPPLREKNAVLDITYEYDKNGIVHIAAVERSSGKPLSLTVHPVPPDVPARFAGRPSDVVVREHLNIYLAFDVSGSMYMRTRNQGTPLEQAREAAEQFVNRCDLTNTSVGLIVFSDSMHLEQPLTQNGKEIIDAIRKLPGVNTGWGNQTDPFDEVYSYFSSTPGICYTIVLADGRWAHQSEAIIKAKRCHEAGIEVIAIGFGGADRDFLNRIASSSEQSFFTDLDKLVETFSTIAQELTESGGEKRQR